MSGLPLVLQCGSPCTNKRMLEIKGVMDARREALLQSINAQREEILTAFLAKYRCEPDDAVQVFSALPNGGFTYYVRKRTDDEKRFAEECERNEHGVKVNV